MIEKQNDLSTRKFRTDKPGQGVGDDLDSNVEDTFFVADYNTDPLPPLSSDIALLQIKTNTTDPTDTEIGLLPPEKVIQRPMAKMILKILKLL